MGGRGSLSGLTVVHVEGKRASPNIFNGMVRDAANMILLSLPKPEAIQIIIHKSFRGGDETIELIDNTMKAFASSNLSEVKLEKWIDRLSQEYERNRRMLNTVKSLSAGDYDLVASRMNASKKIVSGLKKLVREKRRIRKK